MSGKPFTLDQVLEAARAVVDEVGNDYVYDSQPCRYAGPDGAPSCLVGHVINRLDPEAFAMLTQYEHSGGINSTPAALLAGHSGWLPRGFWTAEAANAMQYAQWSQDLRQPWGLALFEAENAGGDAD